MTRTRKTTLVTLLGLLAVAGGAQSATIVQCEDAAGNRSFAANCPPGSSIVETRKYYTGPADEGPDREALKADHPVTLYMVPTCEACDVVRNYLVSHAIPFSEKDVSNDVALQEELTAISGELSVPVVTVGEEIVSGYNNALLESKLEAAGYPTASAVAADSAATTTPQ